MTGQLLSNEQRKLLEEYNNTASDVQQRRSRLILLYDDGLLTYQAAEQAGFSRSQARFWKHQFLMDGLAIFPGLIGRNAAATLPVNKADQLHAIVDTDRKLMPDDDLTVTELPFPIQIKSPGILPADSLAEAGRKTWLFQFAEMIRKRANPPRPTLKDRTTCVATR
jgi:hypothetical protein